MKLSILIATQGRRNKQFKQLLKSLMLQVRQHKDIEVIAYWNNGELPIGEIRDALLEEATGEYVCFVDDDDELPSYYCQEILKHLGEDYVGFRVQLFNDGTEQKPVYHSLRYATWDQDDSGYYRGVTHLNPIKRELALLGKFNTTDKEGEDYHWALTVSPHVKTENFIDKVMYIYRHESMQTSFGNNFQPPRVGYRRPQIAYKQFRWHKNSKQLSKEAEIWQKQ